jgi:hypothetical protein
MSLFEPEEEKSGDVAFDDESKIRLFETQQRESRSGIEYLKKFLPVIALAMIILGGMIWLMQPGIGDAVAVSTDLKQFVYNYMLEDEKRTTSEMTFYKCSGYYWVKVLAEPRSSLSSRDDASNQYRLEVRSPDGKTAEIKTLPPPLNTSNKPCDTGS